MSAHSLSSLGFVLLYSVFVISVNPQWVNYISKYNGVPISWNRLFWAGNQGNNQNFDPSLLGCLKQAKNAFFCFFACFRPYVGLPDHHFRLSHIDALRINLSHWRKDQSLEFLRKSIENWRRKKLSLFESAQWKSVNIYTKIAYSN